MQDTIERRLLIRGDREEVWNRLTNASEVVKWFCERIEGELKLGEEAVLIWGVHRCLIKVVVWEEGRRFGYRWIPGVNDDRRPLQEELTTLVVFTLREVQGGTEVEMIERGFASLPADMAPDAHRENISGWDAELAELQESFA